MILSGSLMKRTVTEMAVSEDYKEFECVKQLGTSYYDKFCHIVDYYGNDFNDRIVLDGSVYTLHDFNTHCINLYKIISETLLESKKAYNEETGLSNRELYLLDLAVLFHDVSMSTDFSTDRKNHSKKSAEYVEKLHSMSESPLSKEGNLSVNEKKALKAIIMAHSDVKDGTVPEEYMGLRDPNLTDDMPARVGTVRARLIAGILRFADELDITSERLGHTNVEEMLIKFEEKQKQLEMKVLAGEANKSEKKELEKYSKYTESLEHWRKLHLFSRVYRKSQDDTVYLVTDDDYILHKIETGDTAEALSRRILDVYNKINREWSDIYGLVIEQSSQKVDIKGFFPISEISLRCGVQSIEDELKRQIDNVNPVKIRNDDTSSVKSIKTEFSENGSDGNYAVNSVKDEIRVTLIDKDFSDLLTAEVKKRHLLKGGHFLLDDIYCARDWVDIREIIETKSLSDEIIVRIIENIRKSRNQNNSCLIIGLDLEGALLASRVAFGLKLAFSYIIPVREYSKSSKKEIAISVKEFDDLILISDAIVSYDTIKKALDNISQSEQISNDELMEKLKQIYTVFYRENSLIKLGDVQEFVAKTFSLNQAFPVEIRKRSDCFYLKEGECIAKNNRME